MYVNMPIIAKLRHWTIQLSSLWNVGLLGARFFIILFERTIKEQFLILHFALLRTSLRDTKLFIGADVWDRRMGGYPMDSRPPVVLLLCPFLNGMQVLSQHIWG